METKEVIVYIRITGETRFGKIDNQYKFGKQIPTEELAKMDIFGILNYEEEAEPWSYSDALANAETKTYPSGAKVIRLKGKPQPKSLALRIYETIRHDAEEANIPGDYHVIIKIGKFQTEVDYTTNYSNAIARALFTAEGTDAKYEEE